VTASSDLIPRERLSAWQRWELASLAESEPPPAPASPVDREAEAAALAAALEDARAQGYREGRAAADAETQRLRTLITALEVNIAQDEQALADDVLELALLLARRIAGEALTIRRELLLPIVDAALRQLPHATRRVQIALNPADVALVRSHLDGAQGAPPHDLVPNAAIEPGGCIVESEACEVDATLATRWVRLAAAMGKSDDWLAHS
jgi:flagellar assembly protein FliH